MFFPKLFLSAPQAYLLYFISCTIQTICICCNYSFFLFLSQAYLLLGKVVNIAGHESETGDRLDSRGNARLYRPRSMALHDANFELYFTGLFLNCLIFHVCVTN